MLGVPDDESPHRIHAAFRDLARRLHPDVAGAGSTRAFQEVAEAYSVLSDPQARLAYDRRLRVVEQPSPASSPVGPGPSLARPVPIHRTVPTPHAGVDLEVFLDPDDVLLGCVVPVALPAFVPCPQCGGRRRDWLVGCGYCSQQGVSETRELLRVRIPPLTPPGALFEVMLPGGWQGDLVLRLHVLHQGGAG